MKFYINLSIFAAFLLITASCKADSATWVKFSQGNETSIVLLPGYIAHPLLFTDTISTLYKAKENETVKLYFSGGGGFSSVALPLINAVRYSKANVICYVTGEVASYHAVLAIACPKLVVPQASVFMFHKIHYRNSSGQRVKEEELTANLKRALSSSNKIVDQILKEVLNNYEMQLMKKDPEFEIWLTGTEVLERLRRSRGH